MINRVLLIDKVAGPTSHDVVQSLRRVLGLRRIGHVGTLDPFATGLLVCCVGPATRLASFLADGDKEYEGSIRLGVATHTLDATGRIVERQTVPTGWEERLAAATAALSGARTQVPPMISAVRVGGQRLYELARAGIEIERRPRPVRIERFTARPAGPAEVAIEVRCSKGTYIRVLAAELGEALGTCACLATLRRTRLGELALDRAARSDVLAELGAERLLAESSISPFEALAAWPVVTLAERAATGVANGVAPARDDVAAVERRVRSGERVRLVDGLGRFLAVAEARVELDDDAGLSAARDASTSPGAGDFRFLRVLTT